MNASRNGATSNNLGLSGTALPGNNLNYSINQGYTGRGVGANGNIQADYKGALAEWNLGYGYDRHRRQVNYGVQGAFWCAKRRHAVPAAGRYGGVGAGARRVWGGCPEPNRGQHRLARLCSRALSDALPAQYRRIGR